MRPRRVIITIEAETDIPVSILRHIKVIDIDSGKYWPIVKNQIKQVQVNVVKEKND